MRPVFNHFDLGLQPAWLIQICIRTPNCC